jgi:hypothetical protein
VKTAAKSIKKSAASRSKPAAKTPQRPTAKKSAAARPPRRADYGAPIDAYFKKQPPPMRAILVALRALVDEVVPDATASLKWGMPFYELHGEMLCALGGFKAHVNLIVIGDKSRYADPDGLLTTGGTSGRHLKLRALDELPHAAVRSWLRTAAKMAREKAKQKK